MDFRIADTLTASLARLTGDEQKAAKTTAFDLQLKAIAELDANEILKQPFADLVAALVYKFRLDMPTLHRENTMQLETEEVDIDVSNDPMRAIIPGRGPYIVKGSNFRIAIPFTGEAGLFKYGTAPYPYINPVVGEIEDNHVILSPQKTSFPPASRRRPRSLRDHTHFAYS